MSSVPNSHLSTNISFISYNIRSLRNKANLLNIYLKGKECKFVCLTEHWLRSDTISCEKICYYSIVSSYCRSINRGGGCVIYSQNHFNMKNEIFKVETSEKDFEYCSASFGSGQDCTLCVCLYRSPSGDINAFLSKLTLLLDVVCRRFSNVIVCGDFNIMFNRDIAESRDTINLFESYDLHRCFYEGTRLNNCIDNVFCGFGLDVTGTGLEDPGMSDHMALLCGVAVREPTAEPVFRRIFSPGNVRSFQLALSSEDWDEVFSLDADVNSGYELFYARYYGCFNRHFPLVKVKFHHSTRYPWYTGAIAIASSDLRQFHSLCKTVNQPGFWNEYLLRRRALKERIDVAKREYYSTKIKFSKNQPRTVWGIINGEKMSDAGGGLHLMDGDVSVDDSAMIARMFHAEFFESGVRSGCASFEPNLPSVSASIFLQPVTESEVLNILSSLAPKFSCGRDGIPPFIMKVSSGAIVSVLTHLVNLMLSQGVFPDALKHAKVVPIHKRGPRCEAANYRPVSVLSCFSKLFEKVIYNKLLNFFKGANVISPSQFGFLPGMSCERALFSSISKILSYTDKRYCVAAVYFDLSRAFDLVNHRLLLVKLNSYGIRGVALDLMASYFRDRYQRVCVGGVEHAHASRLDVGVPQGSILGPLMFVMFVNDLYRQFDFCDLLQFADDTSLIVNHRTVEGLSWVLSEAVGRMAAWCDRNGMVLNTRKTHLMQFSPDSFHRSVLVRSSSGSLPLSRSIKFLGVYFQSNIKWDVHIHELKGRLNKAFYMIYKLRDLLEINALRTFYLGNVQSLMTYGIILWGGSHLSNDIFKLQKRFVRCVLRLNYQESCKVHFKNLKILTLPSLYLYHLLVYCRANLKEFRTNAHISSTFRTRNADRLALPVHSSAAFENGPMYMMIRSYNNLPTDILSSNTLPVFKTRLKDYLINHSFYSITDFMNSVA